MTLPSSGWFPDDDPDKELRLPIPRLSADPRQIVTVGISLFNVDSHDTQEHTDCDGTCSFEGCEGVAVYDVDLMVMLGDEYGVPRLKEHVIYHTCHQDRDVIMHTVLQVSVNQTQGEKNASGTETE